MDVESQTNENTRNIGTLTNAVTELATMFKYEAERAKEDRQGVASIVEQLKGIGAKIDSMAGMQKEMSDVTSTLTELRARYELLKEWKDKYDLSKIQSRLEVLEKDKSEAEGEKKALNKGAHWFWLIFGPVVTAIILGGLEMYFNKGPSYFHSTYTEQSHGPITGE